MPSSAYLNFLFLLLYRHRVKHLAIFLIAVVLVAILSSVMFLSQALQNDISLTLDEQADFVVQRIRAGKAVDTPVDWTIGFSEIPGVTAAVPRVYGQYFHEPNDRYFTVVGVDFFDKQITASLEKLVKGLNIKDFLSRPHMIVGAGVREFLKEKHYSDHYVFRTPEAEQVKVQMYNSLASSSRLVSNDLVLMESSIARKVLGIDEDKSTDIVLYVPNELEGDSVMIKLIGKHFDIRVIQKKELATAYKNLFNYKGGVFLLLFLIALVTYVLIVYQRYSMITGSDRREIGIMRAVGWSIRDVIWLKAAESIVVALAAFLLGVILAYVFVFFFNAPLLSAVFFGFGNMPVDFSLSRSINFGLLSLLFLFFIVPFIAAVIIPVWRVAITDPVEAMK